MDTRQLAAFCAVVERRSFSQAAERLGVTQPAVSLQVRALEKRLGTQLLDRSGRRVEPTEAGMRLFRGAQRMLQLEEQMLDEVASEGAGALTGELSIGASTGPAAVVVPVLLCEFHERHPDLPDLARGPRHPDGRRSRRRSRPRARHRRCGPPPPGRPLRADPRGRGDPDLPARPLVRGPHDHGRRSSRREPDPDAGGRRRPPGRRGRAADARRAPARPLGLARARPAGVRAQRGAGRLRDHVHLADGGRVGPRRGHGRRGAPAGDEREAGGVARARLGAGADARGRGVRRVRRAPGRAG